MNQLSKWLAIAVAICTAGLSLCESAFALSLAVWDPEAETSEFRVKLKPEAVRRIANTFTAAGAEVKLLSAEVIEAGALDTGRFEAFLTYSPALPRMLAKPLKDFTEKGGVAITVAEGVPLLLGMAKDSDGEWRLSPAKPTFAWQMPDLLGTFGLRYDYKPQYHDLGIRHRPSALAADLEPGLKGWDGKLKSMWVVPDDSTLYVPLLSSYRVDSLEVPGPLYAVVKGNRKLIVCAQPSLLLDDSNSAWVRPEKCCRLLLKAIACFKESKWKKSDVHALDVTPPPPRIQPLDAQAVGSVEPEDARSLKRWGRFDGSCMELPVKAEDDGLPRTLHPGAVARLRSVANRQNADPVCLRVRGAYSQADAGLKVTVDGCVLWNERFLTVDTAQAGNFCPSYAGHPYVFTRVIFLPRELVRKESVISVSNPGMVDIWFDAVQLETQTKPRARIIGLGASRGSRIPKAESERWGSVRFSLRTQFAGKPGVADRFDKNDQIVNCALSQNQSLEPIIEGTPAWAAISPERLKEAQKASRPATVPPDPEKYVRLLEEMLPRYKDRFDGYEIWNEADIYQFYRGNAVEYASLFHKVAALVRRIDPGARVYPSGMAGYHPEFLSKMKEEGVFKASDLIALHPYCGDSPAWDLTYGLTESWLYANGVDLEIYCNESGFPSARVPHFKTAKDVSPRNQALAISSGLARLLANGVAKVSVFNAGGTDDAFGLFDRNGVPKPAYHVFSDYLKLGGDGAVRLDASLARADGEALCGVYMAASRRPDRTAVIVINPAEAELTAPIDIVLRLPSAGISTVVPRVESADGKPVACQVRCEGDCIEVRLSLLVRTVVSLGVK